MQAEIEDGVKNSFFRCSPVLLTIDACDSKRFSSRNLPVIALWIDDMNTRLFNSEQFNWQVKNR